jgi:hypothetical protein
MPKWGQDDIVQKLVSKPDDVPKLVCLKGFIGDGPTGKDGKQRVRVYLNHALTSYYEIDDENEIVHRLMLSEDEGSRVWLRHGARLRLVRTRAGEAEIPSLLDGRIAQANLPTAPAAQPRWVIGMVDAQGGPAAGIDWLPIDEGGWEVTQCKYGCASASP